MDLATALWLAALALPPRMPAHLAGALGDLSSIWCASSVRDVDRKSLSLQPRRADDDGRERSGPCHRDGHRASGRGGGGDVHVSGGGGDVRVSGVPLVDVLDVALERERDRNPSRAL